VLLDGSSDDNDVMNITLIANSGTFTSSRIETFNVTGAAGAPELDMTNASGTNAINVSGTVAVKIDALDAQIKQPMITSDSFTRDLNIDLVTTAGTTAAGTAETVNLTVTGASYGTTAATRSSVTIEAVNAGTLETLNITSAGDTANVFALDASTNAAFATVNFLGAQDLTTRVAHADVTGITLNAADATGAQTLVIDRTGATTTATNTNLFTGFANINVLDSATPSVGGDAASLSGLVSGQTITLLDDFNSTVMAFRSVTGSTDSATVVLDNETDATDLDVAALDVQDVETLNIVSSGFATSTSTAGVNLIDDLTGDATTITVSGDTSLDLDLNIDAAASGTRVVTVNASTNTAFVDMVAAASTTVSYSLTGSDGNDILTLNALGGTLVGGAGNDTLTGSALNDTISTGAGTDTVFATTGTDAVTFGDGVDTIIFGEADVAVSAQTALSADVDLALTTVAADDDLVVTVNGRVYTLDIATDGDTGDDIAVDFVALHAANILADTGVTVTSSAVVVSATGAGKLLFTGAADGTAFTARVDVTDDGVITTNAVVTTAGVEAVVVDTTITGFTTGSGGDVITVDFSEMNAASVIGNLVDSSGDLTNADTFEFVEYTAGIALAATGITATANLVKVAYSNSINSAADLIALMGNGFTLDAAPGADADVIMGMFYDTDSAAMRFGFFNDTDADAIATTTGEFDDTNSSFTEIATVGMTSTEYTALVASNFAIVA
jgi:hypothetical protein